MLCIILYAGVLGLLVGSAVNAAVWRLYVKRSWTRGRSMCPECKHVLAARDLVPVLSWLVLRGRCRYCKARIHWQYPVVELLTGALFALSVAKMAPQTLADWGQLGLWLAILTLLIVLAVYDTRWMLLPDRVMIPAILLSLMYVVFEVWHRGSLMSARGPLMAAILAGGAFYILVVVSKGRAMGGGDIKLVFLMGLLLGLRGLAVALFLAFNVAAIVGLALIGLRQKRRRDHIAFGPFLVGGTVVAFLFGHDIVQWYLALNGLGPSGL